MVTEDCPICGRLDHTYQGVASSIQKLKQLVRVARAASDSGRLKTLVDTLGLMESEADDLLRAIERHREHDHRAGA